MYKVLNYLLEKRGQQRIIIDPLNVTFATLVDLKRRAFLTELTVGEASVNMLTAPFAMRLPAVSKHINVQKKLGLLPKPATPY